MSKPSGMPLYDCGYAKGRKDAIDEIRDVLIIDGNYGHKTFSLTYLKGLLKQIKEQKK